MRGTVLFSTCWRTITMTFEIRGNGFITCCGVRRIERDHAFWFVWIGKKLEPEIICKSAGKAYIIDNTTGAETEIF